LHKSEINKKAYFIDEKPSEMIKRSEILLSSTNEKRCARLQVERMNDDDDDEEIIKL